VVFDEIILAEEEEPIPNFWCPGWNWDRARNQRDPCVIGWRRGAI